MLHRISGFAPVFVIFLLMCAHPLDDIKITGCDVYDESAEQCTQPAKEQIIYEFKVPKAKLKSWRELSYYMYFHSRQTPGIRLQFAGSLSDDEQEQLRKNGHCSYRLYRQSGDYEPVTGEMEGFRVYEDGLWCFDYLGAMLLKFLETNGLDESIPDTGLNPVEVEITAVLPALNGKDTEPQAPGQTLTKSLQRTIFLEFSQE